MGLPGCQVDPGVRGRPPGGGGQRAAAAHDGRADGPQPGVPVGGRGQLRQGRQDRRRLQGRRPLGCRRPRCSRRRATRTSSTCAAGSTASATTSAASRARAGRRRGLPVDASAPADKTYAELEKQRAQSPEPADRAGTAARYSPTVHAVLLAERADEVAVLVVQLRVGAAGGVRVLERARTDRDDLVGVGHARLGVQRLAGQIHRRRRTAGGATPRAPASSARRHQARPRRRGAAAWPLRRAAARRSPRTSGSGAASPGARPRPAPRRPARRRRLGARAAEADHLLRDRVARIEADDLRDLGLHLGAAPGGARLVGGGHVLRHEQRPRLVVARLGAALVDTVGGICSKRSIASE